MFVYSSLCARYSGCYTCGYMRSGHVVILASGDMPYECATCMVGTYLKCFNSLPPAHGAWAQRWIVRRYRRRTSWVLYPSVPFGGQVAGWFEAAPIEETTHCMPGS